MICTPKFFVLERTKPKVKNFLREPINNNGKKILTSLPTTGTVSKIHIYMRSTKGVQQPIIRSVTI